MVFEARHPGLQRATRLHSQQIRSTISLHWNRSLPWRFPVSLRSATVPLAGSKSLYRSPLERIFDQLVIFFKVFASFAFQDGKKDFLADEAFR